MFKEALLEVDGMQQAVDLPAAGVLEVANFSKEAQAVFGHC